MTRQERYAWFSLITVAVATTSFLILIPLMGFKHAFAGFSFLGILGFAPFFMRPKKTDGPVIEDERDVMIQAKSWQIATAIFWVAFILSSVSTSVWAGSNGNGTISADVLILFPLLGWILLTLVQSIVTLTLYKKGK